MSRAPCAVLASVAGALQVRLLGRKAWWTAVKGSNGLLCIVERSWGAATDDADFWNPKVRGVICFNPPAARSFLPIFLMKTKLVLAGKSKTEIVAAIASARAKQELPRLEPGAMCYMLSRQQYLNDRGQSWHPHLMFPAPGDAANSCGANLPDSPLLAANDPEEGVTIFMVLVGKWSDGTPAVATP